MKLQNILPHMREGSVKVGQETYHLDAEGKVDVSDEAAELLLQNKAAWRKVSKRNPVVSDAAKDEATGVDYNKFLKPDLMTMAKKFGLKVDNKMTKAEIIALISYSEGNNG